MCFDTAYFKCYNKVKGENVRQADSTSLSIEGVGDIELDCSGKLLCFTDVLHGPRLGTNLISLGKLTGKGASAWLTPDGKCEVSREGKVLMEAMRTENNVYAISGIQVIACEVNVVDRKAEPSIWHARLGHVNMRSLNGMAREKLVAGINEKDVEDVQVHCEGSPSLNQLRKGKRSFWQLYTLMYVGQCPYLPGVIDSLASLYIHPRIQYTVPGCSTPLIFNGKEDASCRLADGNEQCIMGQNVHGQLAIP